MGSRTRRQSPLLTACAVAGAAMVALAPGSSAHAAMIQLDVASMGSVAGAQSALAGFRTGKRRALTETFESFEAWDGAGSTATNDPLATAVGAFASLGSHGTGSACVNGCSGLQVGNASSSGLGVSGRTNTTAGGVNWLDSNDVEGIGWSVDASGIGGRFTDLAFLLTDVADVGATLDVQFAGGASASARILPRQPNGHINFVTARFGGLVSSATVNIRNTHGATTNDGFGIDDATVAVPVPGTVALFGAGLLALAGGARRRPKG